MTCPRCGRQLDQGRECPNRRECGRRMSAALAKVRAAMASEITIAKHKPLKGQGEFR